MFQIRLKRGITPCFQTQNKKTKKTNKQKPISYIDERQRNSTGEKMIMSCLWLRYLLASRNFDQIEKPDLSLATAKHVIYY